VEGERKRGREEGRKPPITESSFALFIPGGGRKAHIVLRHDKNGKVKVYSFKICRKGGAITFSAITRGRLRRQFSRSPELGRLLLFSFLDGSAPL
jgi:hypothetical protein